MARKRKEEEIDPVSLLLMIVIVGIYLIWKYIIEPFIDWSTNFLNRNTTLIFGVIFISVLLSAAWLGRKKHEDEIITKKIELEFELEKSIKKKKLLKERSHELEDLTDDEKDFLLEKWTTEELANECNNFSNEILEEEPKFKTIPLPLSKTDTIYKNVVDFLKDDDFSFRYGKNKKEKDYQQDLEQRFALLKYKYGYDTRYEAKQGKHRVDFVIENLVGIEMKVHRGGNQVEKDLYYQITHYGKLYPKMIGLVVNDSDKENDELKKEIEASLSHQNVIDKKDVKIIIKSV